MGSSYAPWVYIYSRACAHAGALRRFGSACTAGHALHSVTGRASRRRARHENLARRGSVLATRHEHAAPTGQTRISAPEAYAAQRESALGTASAVHALSGEAT